jgi:N-acetylmuramate 1-kinase
VLMDAPRQPDGPIIRVGKTYSQIAHLAEDVRSFVRISWRLADAGLNVPVVLARDEDKGLLLLSDLGDDQFGRALDRGVEQATLWRAATDALIHLRKMSPDTNVALHGEAVQQLPRFDRAALEIEVSLLLDWYWPHHVGAPLTDKLKTEYSALWSVVFDRMLAREPGWFLRDYHSPNLLWQANAQGLGRVGVIDFQDALAEHWAYDLASLLQDARRDVPADLERELLAHYCAEVARHEPQFDEPAFRLAYADFGTQRNTRLVGLWVRLLKRDGKPNYLQHMPRTWSYLERNLAHPGLSDLKAWFDRHIPEAVRKRPVNT